MELKFLGRGSAFNTKEGNTSAYCKKGESMLLIDCGETVFSRIRELNLLEGVKTLDVFITHFHPDHAGSLGSLIFYCNYGVKEKIKVNIHFPDCNVVEEYLLMNGVYNDGSLYTVTDKTYFYNEDLRIDGFDFIGVKHEYIEKVDGINYLNGKNINRRKTIFSSYAILMFSEDYDDGFLYSGDCKIDKEFIEDYIISLIEEDDDTKYKFYLDCCKNENIMHTDIGFYINNIPENYRDRVHLMHIDCDEVIDIAEKNNFNVVEVVNNSTK